MKFDDNSLCLAVNTPSNRLSRDGLRFSLTCL